MPVFLFYQISIYLLNFPGLAVSRSFKAVNHQFIEIEHKIRQMLIKLFFTFYVIEGNSFKNNC